MSAEYRFRGVGLAALLSALTLGLCICVSGSMPGGSVDPTVPIMQSGLVETNSGISLPDVGRFLDFLRRLIEYIKIGGVAFALIGSGVFIGTWVISHVRRPRMQSSGPVWWGYLALWSSYIPVGLTLVAALGTFVPVLSPLILKSFALAILAAALSWCLAVGALVSGGHTSDLRRARKALLLAGTPWYCLALWLAHYLN